MGVTSILRELLRKRPCIAYNSEVYVELDREENCLCPDISVSCDRIDYHATKVIHYPCVVAQVVSESILLLCRISCGRPKSNRAELRGENCPYAVCREWALSSLIYASYRPVDSNLHRPDGGRVHRVCSRRPLLYYLVDRPSSYDEEKCSDTPAAFGNDEGSGCQAPPLEAA